MKTFEITAPFTGNFTFDVTDSIDSADAWQEAQQFIEKQIKEMINSFHIDGITLSQHVQIVEKVKR